MRFNQGTHEYTVLTANEIKGEFAALELPNIDAFDYKLEYSADFKSLLIKLTVNAATDIPGAPPAADGNTYADVTYKTIDGIYLRHLPSTALKIVQKPSSRAGTKTAHSKAKGSTGKQVKKSSKGGSSEGGGEGGSGETFRNLMPAFRASFRPQARNDLTTQRRDQLIAALADYGAVDLKSSNKRHTLWFEPFAQSADNKAFHTTPHTNDNAQGIMAGYHYMTADKHVIGLAAMAMFNKNAQPSDKRNK